MRRFWYVICALMILSCSACSSVRSTDQNKAINERYARAATFAATCEVRMDHGETVSDYVIGYRFDAGLHTLAVQSPAVLNGLTVTVGADGLEIRYAGAVFAPPSLAGTGVSPVKILCDVFLTWQNGYATATASEKTDAGAAIVYTVSSAQTGEELTYRTWFLEETKMPLRAECFSGENLVMTVAFADCLITELEE